MKPHEPIIAKFGGIRPLARALGHSTPSTVQGWARRGVVPVQQQPNVIAAAQRLGVELDPVEFVVLPGGACGGGGVQ